MFRTTTLLALTAASFLPTLTSSATACNHRQVRYYAQPSTARVVRTTRVTHQPAVVVKPATYSTVSLVTKKTEIAIKPTYPELTVGSTVTASANFLGSEQGFVFVQLGSATLQCEVVDWSVNSVTFKTPNLGLRKPATATLELVRPDGRIVRDYKVSLSPKADLVVHDGTGPDIVPPNSGHSAPKTAEASGILLEAPAVPIVEASVVVAQ